MAKFRVSLIKKIDDSYDIEIGTNLFKSLIEDLKNDLFPKASRYAIITDSNVYKLYVQNFEKMLLEIDALSFKIYQFLAGENSKTRETKAEIEDKMLKDGFGRDSAIIAIGGGVVSDLAGFLAGTFGRGIPFVNYATTLLSAADASIGGKTAVDTPIATNLIGLFHQPQKVYIDLNTWETLPPREISSGLAETIKHACLGDGEFFNYLEKNINKVITPEGALLLDASTIEYIAHKNCQIKYNIVSQDEKEANLRQVLNLGHTFGRAMEVLCEYRYLHGECVSIGLAFQSFIAMKRKLVSEEDCKRIISLLQRTHLPTNVPNDFTDEEITKKMHTDKKARQGDIYFVLQKGIGSMYEEEGNYGIKYNDKQIIEEISQYRRFDI